MPKLINADDLSAKLNEMSYEPGYQHPDEDWQCGLSMAMSAVDEAPAVDAVEVVRCKNCKHCTKYENWAKRKYLGCDLTYGEIHEVDPEHYCSYGERK